MILLVVDYCERPEIPIRSLKQSIYGVQCQSFLTKRKKRAIEQRDAIYRGQQDKHLRRKLTKEDIRTGQVDWAVAVGIGRCGRASVGGRGSGDEESLLWSLGSSLGHPEAVQTLPIHSSIQIINYVRLPFSMLWRIIALHCVTNKGYR